MPAAVNILKNSKSQSTRNITRPQITALRKLIEDSSITIVPADKDRAVVVMNFDHYNRKIMELLNDENTYER